MRDFYAHSSPAPLDQADGLRRMFEGRQSRVLALVANPHVDRTAAVLDALACALARLGRKVLVVDAAHSAPEPPELARLDLGAAVERVGANVAYLPARGLPLAYVDTRGSAARFIDAAHAAAPSADTLLLHAEAGELARVLARRAARPLLLGSDHPESIKHTYAACKLVAARTGLATFDLLLVAAPQCPRLKSIAITLSSCAERFLGVLVRDWAVLAVRRNDTTVEPAGDGALERLLAAQLEVEDVPGLPVPATDHSRRAAFR